MTGFSDVRAGPIALSRGGSGEPLLLLHPLGLSRRTWTPVLAPLADSFDVLAADLPGHGASSPLPAGSEPTPAALATAVAAALHELGLPTVHLAGNSVGGWVALELARLGAARSVTLVSP